MADAMDRVRAAEERYNAVIESTTKLQTTLRDLEREAEQMRQVVSRLRQEWELEERAVKAKRQRQDEEDQKPARWWGWIFAIMFTGFMGALFGDFVREAGDRLRIILFA